MKRNNILKWQYALLAVLAVATLSSCTLFGLKKQTDFHRRTDDTVDAHINMTAWAYIKSRGLQSPVKADTPFALFQRVIIYSGIDTNEYIKPGRTFIFPNAASCKAVWAAFTTATNAVGKKWQDYPKTDLKNYLSYLIIDGQYSHYNLPIADVDMKTLAPAGTYTAVPPAFQIKNLATYPNATSVMRMKVLNSSPSNTSDYPLIINGTNTVITSDILATNGVIQVVSTAVSPAIVQ
ncbi:fasciclin domain-containing protein [Mucilaginibacter mali]|uniref:Fasciclin domain-containing protein n=1 Tax=Mucilaginibacter mali TaxID=2740462 RepID=A0A7D4QCH5_9SPHI|nr:fasciclin domain-containing protein [Mucilaginibacter mali]QKJ32305.1 fasciclin domain-containing protein [Mucilaginibacter mali]